ncbi:MAG TPA: PIN domain-containing protein, partial [Verrucomicrobiae bacterium]|nr:PIN domain-containing protein [Verrucomicrobiae bacterium]
MKAVFCDTFFFFAAINRRDKHHDAALQWSNAYDGPLLTTPWVVTEVANALSAVENRRLFEPFYRALTEDQRLRIVAAGQPLWERGLALYF